MHPVAIFTLIIIVINVVVSVKGFKSPSFFERYLFRVDDVLAAKQYDRMVTSGFLHLDWKHLIFNMITLYLFGDGLEAYLGIAPFLIVYFAGLVGGSLLALFIHRQHGDYSAAGASGAVCGIIFASIALFPGMEVAPLFIPVHVPGWLFGLGYILYTIYGVRSKVGNIGHEAHLGGALVGMYTAVIFHPEAVQHNLVAIAVISLPSIAFMYIIITRPYVLFVDNFYFNSHPNATLEDRYNLKRADRQREIDGILEKIHNKGINSLTKAEKDKLDEYSNSR